MNGPVRIWKPTLDVNDLHASTEFWTWLLGADVILEIDDWAVHLGPPGGPAALALQRVEEPRVGKNRLHLDTTADDVDAVTAEIEARGGSRVAGPNLGRGGAVRWFVMADPEGNEFCVSTPIPGV